jgi:hypothetical protein
VRRQILRILAGLTAFVVVSAGDPTGAEEVRWKRIACLSGAIDRAEVDARGGTLTLEARLDCADPSGEAQYGFASYSDGEKGFGYMNWFGRAGYALGFTTTFADARPLRSPDLAIRVVTDYTARIGCVGVTRTSSGASFTVHHLVPDEVTKLPPFIVVGCGVGRSPACGSCW